MSTSFSNSLFYHALFGKKDSRDKDAQVAILGGVSGSRFDSNKDIHDIPLVVFDFETTGLNIRTSKIIEIGAVKFLKRKEIARFTALINPKENLTQEIAKITGINDDMLKNKPFVEDILPGFHDFLRGSLGFAHNAEFDLGMLVNESERIGVHCDYTIICTLKMARALIDIERRNLDALAKHYNLTFESRHRSIGDILVTAQVLWKMLDENPGLKKIHDLELYRQTYSL